tara:strand:+ start:281 stop:691 length:411 start_codon:yes stop_codon:yes gene_type:complete
MRTKKEKGPNLLGIGKKINNVVDRVTNLKPTITFNNTPPPPTITPPTPPTPETETETETPVVNPQEEELKRQAREVMSGNVNAAQAEYFRQQNEGLFELNERKGEKMTGVNPVSNRRDGMSELFGGLYGSEESRGF